MKNKNMKLLSYMALKGYNQTTLSKEIRMNKVTLCNKINGNREFKEPEMMLIANALECQVTDIFFNNELPNEQKFTKEEATVNEWFNKN